MFLQIYTFFSLNCLNLQKKDNIIDNMNKEIGVLFDLDGVLLDTEGIYTDFWQTIDNKYPTGVPGFTHIIKGSNLTTILDTYYPNKQLQEIIIRILDDFEKDMVYRPFPDAIRFLKELRSAGIPTSVVTSSSMLKMQNAFRQLPHFRELFDGLVTGDMVKYCKPNPEGYLLGAKQIGINPECCYVFEDSLQGIQAGLNAGCKVIALTTTVDRKVIEKTKANKIINDFAGFSISDLLFI